MKRQLYLVIFIIFSFFLISFSQNKNEYKIIKIVDGDTFYLDFNFNNYPDKNEKVRINGIDTYETKVNDGLKRQMKIYHLSKKEAIGMGYLAYKYAQKELLGKVVKIEYSSNDRYDKYNRSLVSIYYDCKNNICKNYEEEILKQGLANIYTKSNKANYLVKFYNKNKMKEQISSANKLDLFFYDYINNKCYELNSNKMDGYGQVNLKEKTFREKFFGCSN